MNNVAKRVANSEKLGEKGGRREKVDDIGSRKKFVLKIIQLWGLQDSFCTLLSKKTEKNVNFLMKNRKFFKIGGVIPPPSPCPVVATPLNVAHINKRMYVICLQIKQKNIMYYTY